MQKVAKHQFVFLKRIKKVIFCTPIYNVNASAMLRCETLETALPGGLFPRAHDTPCPQMCSSVEDKGYLLLWSAMMSKGEQEATFRGRLHRLVFMSQWGR